MQHSVQQPLQGAQATYAALRFGLTDTDALGLTTINTCEELMGRGHYPTEPMSDEEARLPMAYTRVVYRDYVLLERILAITYQPQNLYCYAVDVKANAVFKQRLRQLASCVPKKNMIVIEEFNTTSAGQDINRAYLGCLQELKRAGGQWKYVLMMPVSG